MQPHDGLPFIIALILITPSASGFGYLQETTRERASPGDEVHFGLYLYGTNESVTVTKTDAPADWRVNVDRNHVTFPVDAGFRYMETGNGYRTVVPVQVTATIPPNATAGRHTLTATITGQPTGTPQNQTVAVKQVQDSSFTVTVASENEGPSQDAVQPVQNEGGAAGMTITGSDQDDPDAAQETSPAWQNPVFLLVLFEITWGIAVIYVWKRRNR
jgi:hypothetical protein